MERLSRASLATGFTFAIVFGAASALLVGYWVMRDFERSLPPNALDSAYRRGVRKARALLLHPLTQWVMTCLAIWVNQIVFNAYVAKVHGGDPAFLLRYLGHGWCVLRLDDPFVRLVAGGISSGEPHPVLALSVLRVQAFLELPFTIFAYLAITRLLSPRLYRALTRLPILLLVGVFFTIPLCLAELNLANPWTLDDVVIRLVACVVVPIYVARVAAREEPDVAMEPEPVGVLGLLSFLIGAGAIALMVLALYDAFLIYNYGHLGRHATVLGGGVIVAAVATYAAPRADALVSGEPSDALAAFRTALIAFTALFFVPSLAIRYFAASPIAEITGAGLILGGTIAGLVGALRARHPFRVVVSALCGIAVGALAVAVTLPKVGGGELAFAQVALAFLVPAILTMRATEMLWNPVATATS